MVQVDPSYRRQGLATLMCKTMAKKLAERGRDSCAFISPENKASGGMFERIGFKAVDEVIWFGTDIGKNLDWIKY